MVNAERRERVRAAFEDKGVIWSIAELARDAGIGRAAARKEIAAMLRRRELLPLPAFSMGRSGYMLARLQGEE